MLMPFSKAMICIFVWLSICSKLRKVNAVSMSDCIHEKFYRFTPEHTACISKASDATQSGVSDEDKKIIVDKHNELRALQNATNMQKMEWDDELADIAQRWSDNCVFAHDKYRTVPGKYSVGQNLAAGQQNWTNVVQAWYDEIKDFNYGVQGSFSAVGHYTQVVWAESSKIGCGYTYCTDLSYEKLYACNYGPSGNSNDWSKPYVQGNNCDACPDGCSGGLCDCGGKTCFNDGKLNLTTCQCECSKPWQVQPSCSVNCSAVTESSFCQPGAFYDGKCLTFANVPSECPKLCNVCPYAGVGYDLEENTDAQPEGDDNSKKNGGVSLRLYTSLSLAFIFCLASPFNM